ncbi:hypothetical protein YC2023_079494 [Brassica napus]
MVQKVEGVKEVVRGDVEGYMEIYPYSVFYMFFKQYLDIWKTSLINLSIAIAAVFAVCLVITCRTKIISKPTSAGAAYSSRIYAGTSLTISQTSSDDCVSLIVMTTPPSDQPIQTAGDHTHKSKRGRPRGSLTKPKVPSISAKRWYNQMKKSLRGVYTQLCHYLKDVTHVTRDVKQVYPSLLSRTAAG